MNSLEKDGKMSTLKHYKRGIKNHKTLETLPGIGNIVLIIDDNNPKSKWNLGKIFDVIKGRNGIRRGYKIRNNKGYTMERPLQLIRDLEIKITNNEINQAPIETNEHAEIDGQTTYEQKAKMETRD